MESTTVSPNGLEKLRTEAVKLLRQGKHADASVRIKEALSMAPSAAEWHNLLGSALAGLGKHDEARASFHFALELKPDYVEAIVNLGHDQHRMGRNDEALIHYRQALTIKPEWAEIHNTVGLILRRQGKLSEAEGHFRQALRAQPHHGDSRNNLGVVLADQNRWPEAEAVYRQVLRQQPKASSTHNNLGVSLLVQRKVRDAIDSFQTALRIQPNYAEALNNLGNAQLQAGKFEEAEQSLRRALELKPDLAEACNNLASVLIKQGKLDDGRVQVQQALRMQPGYTDAHKNLADCLLLMGDYAQAWPEQDWRWRGQQRFQQPRWRGEPLADKTILLHADHASSTDDSKLRGDTLQMVRYAGLLQAQGASVVVECHADVMPLLARTPGINQIVPRGKPLPSFDFHAPFLSLPGVVRTTLENVPHRVPYVFADPGRVTSWGNALSNLGKLKVGFAWQTPPQEGEERQKRIPLSFFGQLAQIDGVRLVSLQRAIDKDSVHNLLERWKAVDAAKKIDESGIEALSELAAVMKNLDVVITPDIDLAHLAGSLGVAAWVLLPKVPDWRWLMGRHDSPWYPTMRLFRQKEWGKWQEVFEQLAVELQRLPPLEKPGFYWQRGLALMKAGKIPEAVASFRRGLVLAPEDSVLHTELGAALMRQDNKEEALSNLERAAALKKDNVDALFHLGNLLREMQRNDEAEKRFREGLAHQPNSPALLNHLGLLLLWQAKHEEAEKLFRHAARLMSDSPGAYLNNLGILLEQENRLDEAVVVFQKALAHKEDAPDAHKNLGMIHLVRGDYARGWAEYEWRLKTKGRERPFEQPRWDGKPLQGKPILLWTEQGHGDTIQFIRYAQMVKERGGYVIVECRDLVKPLLARCPGIDQTVTQGGPLPDFACHSALLSLPYIFHTNEHSIPGEVPYLSADPARIAHWKSQLEDIGPRRVGISWQGSPTFGNDRNRSIPLRHYEPLARVPGVRLISLQKGFGQEQIQKVAENWGIVDWNDRLDVQGGAFLDTAAVIRNLDLVITSDTAIAHLAGALGAPVWLALGQGCDWRWLRDREDSPWYPTMRLFRQRRWGDWGEVLERMAHELRKLSDLNLAAGPILAEVSPGELLDKITILEIKRDQLHSEGQRGNVQRELGSLWATRARHFKMSAAVESLAIALKEVNLDLWRIEDEIRNEEAKQDFGPRFIELARAVYQRNDERSRIKRKINDLLGSQIIEEKSYGQASGHVPNAHV